MLKPLETALVYEGYNLIQSSKAHPIRQYNPRLINSYNCEGNYKPGFYEQAKYFFDNYKSLDKEVKHSDLNQCLLTSSLIEELIE